MFWRNNLLNRISLYFNKPNFCPSKNHPGYSYKSFNWPATKKLRQDRRAWKVALVETTSELPAEREKSQYEVHTT